MDKYEALRADTREKLIQPTESRSLRLIAHEVVSNISPTNLAEIIKGELKSNSHIGTVVRGLIQDKLEDDLEIAYAQRPEQYDDLDYVGAL